MRRLTWLSLTKMRECLTKSPASTDAQGHPWGPRTLSHRVFSIAARGSQDVWADKIHLPVGSDRLHPGSLRLSIIGLFSGSDRW